jgi:hypothetical protein
MFTCSGSFYPLLVFLAFFSLSLDSIRLRELSKVVLTLLLSLLVFSLTLAGGLSYKPSKLAESSLRSLFLRFLVTAG